jgi:hypothetical protein
MPNPAGTQVVRRDYTLLTALALARYLTGDQVARLVFQGRDERVPRRRLNRLAGPGPQGLDPLVRALSYRGPTGAPLKAWALTEAGYVTAKRVVPYVAAPAGDVGPAFLEHSLLLNDVLVDLVLKVRTDPEDPFTDLPFRWIPESGEYVTFEHYNRKAQAIERARIRPDATLEIGEPRRRLFLECETGSHTLVSSDPNSTGATYAKIQRYTHLLAGSVGQHDSTTPYSLLCPDGFAPILIFLIHSDRRRDAIRKMVADPKRAVRIKVRAYTFQEAVDLLAALSSGSPAPLADPHVAGLTASQLELVRLALSQCHGTLEEARRTLEQHNRLPQQAGRPAPVLRFPHAPGALRDALALVARLRAAASEAGSLPRVAPVARHERTARDVARAGAPNQAPIGGTSPARPEPIEGRP